MFTSEERWLTPLQCRDKKERTGKELSTLAHQRVGQICRHLMVLTFFPSITGSRECGGVGREERQPGWDSRMVGRH